MATSITLRNGEKVKVNDHVYCAPVWGKRDGTPYSVARVMEFLPAEGSAWNKGKGKETPTRVRLAWYYRPSDVSDRATTDSRILLAAIYSEVTDITQLRSKCFVIHRDKISDLAGWKKRPDRFYFNRLFDPYIRKEFDVIRSETVRNVPPHIRETLVGRYEYVVAEKEYVPELVDNFRDCHACQEWCSGPEAVQCDRCKTFYHMKCVNPPLLAKPSRGYGWSCAQCSMEKEEDLDPSSTRHGTPSRAKPVTIAARGRGRPKKDRSKAEMEENLDIKHFKMWPFRYFGQYTPVEDTADPDDLIFPRAATRIGPRFQATIGAENEDDQQDEERGSNATIDIISNYSQLNDAQKSEFDKSKWSITEDLPPRTKDQMSISVDWLNELYHRLSSALSRNQPLANVSMAKVVRPVKWKTKDEPYIDTSWTPQESATFEDGIQVHGPELRVIRDEIGTRSHAEVVRYYGHWKNHCLGLKSAKAHLDADAPSRRQTANTESSDSSDDSDVEGSIDLNIKKNDICGACRTTESKTWWKSPKGLSTNCLCNNCGLNWRKYADLNVRPIREDLLVKTKGDKREASPLVNPTAKRLRTANGASPAPSSLVRCLACHKNGPLGKILRCSVCLVRCHAAVCGEESKHGADANDWSCDLCLNEKNGEPSLNTHCVLCPKPKPELGTSSRPFADSFLRICKPTEGQGWAHTLCSVFIPEIQFTSSIKLQTVEAISTIFKQRWQGLCSICHKAEGAVVKCGDCPKEFHVSCAWQASHHFGFEIKPVKSSRRETSSISSFAGESGLMESVICCKSHDVSKRGIFGLCEIDDSGLTALQVYCKLKQAATDQAHALLRKARRLDQILEPVAQFHAIDSSGPECEKCGSEYSPLFHPTHMTNGVVNGWTCNACFVEEHSIKIDLPVLENGMVH